MCLLTYYIILINYSRGQPTDSLSQTRSKLALLKSRCFLLSLIANRKQGIAGDTNPLAQDYLVWANTELGNVMTYENYMNQETKSQCDLNIKV